MNTSNRCGTISLRVSTPTSNPSAIERQQTSSVLITQSIDDAIGTHETHDDYSFSTTGTVDLSEIEMRFAEYPTPVGAPRDVVLRRFQVVLLAASPETDGPVRIGLMELHLEDWPIMLEGSEGSEGVESDEAWETEDLLNEWEVDQWVSIAHVWVRDDLRGIGIASQCVPLALEQLPRDERRLVSMIAEDGTGDSVMSDGLRAAVARLGFEEHADHLWARIDEAQI